MAKSDQLGIAEVQFPHSEGMLKMLLKNEKGSALVMVLLVVVVASIVGVAILSIGVNEDVQVSAEEKSLQAYYIARAAAEGMAQYIIDYPSVLESGTPIEDDLGNDLDTVEELIDKLEEGGSDEINFAGGTAVVTVTRVGDGVEIAATSEYLDNFVDSQTIIMEYNEAFDHLIWTEQDLDPSSLEVGTDPPGGGPVSLASNGEVDPESVDTDSTADAEYHDNVDEFYDEPYIPNNSSAISGPTEIGNNYNLNINGTAGELLDNFSVVTDTYSSDNVRLYNESTGEYYESGGSDVYVDAYYFDRIEINNGGTLNIDCSASDVNIVVDSMYIKGDLLITGTHNLNLYVKGDSNSYDLDIQTDMFGGGNDADQLRVYLKENTAMQFQANGDFNAFVYGPNASIDFRATNIEFTGAIIGEIFDNNSQPNLYYSEPSGDFFIDLFFEIVEWRD